MTGMAKPDSRRTEAIVSQSVDILRSLVGFDSVSHHSNLPLIEFIESYFRKHHVHCVRIPSPDGKKSNLLARIGPEKEGGVILSGHTDVVPVEGQAWDSDPFKVVEREGRFFGRGTSDMKSFIAICLAMAPLWTQRTLRRPIWMAFSYDEEVGCLGVPLLLEQITRHMPRPAFALIGEPTGMEVVTAHKGVLSFETTVTGHEWHSSQPQLGVNAVHVACELIHYLHGVAREMSVSGMRDARFNPPYSTVHVGTVRGGTARNIIPRECAFQWEIRPLPGEDYEAIIHGFREQCRVLESEMRKTHAQAGIVTQPKSHMAGVTLPAEAHLYCQLVMRCAQTNHEHAVSFGTEAGVFNDYGVPAIICGPGSIEQAHKPNEFIELSQIRACVEFMLRLTEGESLFTP